MPEPTVPPIHASQVQCPACNAAPGEACNQPTSTGRTNVRWYHYARENVASGWASGGDH